HDSHSITSSATWRYSEAELTCRAPVDGEVEPSRLHDGPPPSDSFGVGYDSSRRPGSDRRSCRLSDLCRGQRGGLLVVAFGSPGGDHCIWDLEWLIEYGRGDDPVGSKVPDVVAQFAPRADERRLHVISDGKWLDDPLGAAARLVLVVDPHL